MKKKSDNELKLTENTDKQNIDTTSISDESINVDSTTILDDDCMIEKIILNDIDELTINSNQETTIVNKKDRILNPRMTRYEMVRILGEREKQLTMGAKPLIKNHNGLTYGEIAVEELITNMIPLKIKRVQKKNVFEIWNIEELDKTHILSYIE